MTNDENTKLGPSPWGSDPIRGVNYDYLDIVQPPSVDPKPVIPTPTEYSATNAQDFYQRIRGKIVKWAQGAGAGRETTQYILLLPDIMALFVRLMADPRVSTQLKAEIAAASAYIIIPIDLMPEAVMGPAGLIDDAIVGVLALNRVIKVMGQAGENVLRQNWDGDEDILKVIEDLLVRADKFVTGTVWSGIKTFMQNASGGSRGRAAPAKGPIIEGSAKPIVPPENER